MSISVKIGLTTDTYLYKKKAAAAYLRNKNSYRHDMGNILLFI
jgi:hypothetical protein